MSTDRRSQAKTPIYKNSNIFKTINQIKLKYENKHGFSKFKFLIHRVAVRNKNSQIFARFFCNREYTMFVV